MKVKQIIIAKICAEEEISKKDYKKITTDENKTTAKQGFITLMNEVGMEVEEYSLELKIIDGGE